MLGMITINLLPPELRQKEKTPLSRFVLLLVGIVILFSTCSFFFYFRYSLLQFAKDERTAKQEDLANVKKRHTEYTALMDLKRKYEERGTTIDGIRLSRIRWGIKLMQFYDFFSIEAFRDKAWIDGLQMSLKDASSGRRGRNDGPESAGELKFTVNTKGGDMTGVTDFREALRGLFGTPTDLVNGAAFWADFLDLNDPSPTLVEDEDMQPPLSYTEKITLQIKPREDPSKKKK